jgi:hypothetical protein
VPVVAISPFKSTVAPATGLPLGLSTFTCIEYVVEGTVEEVVVVAPGADGVFGVGTEVFTGAGEVVVVDDLVVELPLFVLLPLPDDLLLVDPPLVFELEPPPELGAVQFG